MAGVVTTGIALGGVGQKLIINYSKSKYDAKISELQGYVRELEKHQSAIEGYRKRLRSVWNDSDAEKYEKILGKQAKAVWTAANRAKSLKDAYQKVSDDLQRQKTTSEGIIDGINSALNALGIGDE